MSVNIFGEDWEGGRDRPGWQWKHLPVGRKLGAKQIGASLYELAPAQKTFPYHWHQLEEEWLIVLSGEPTLRDPSGERRLAPGDCVVFEPGPEGAHSIGNDTDEPVPPADALLASPRRISASTRTAARSGCSARACARSCARTPRSTTSRARSSRGFSFAAATDMAGAAHDRPP